MEGENGTWQLREQDAWVPANPANAPPPPDKPKSAGSTASAPGRANLVPLLAVGGVLALCLCAVVGFLALNALGVITTQVNLFGTATPTFSALNATPVRTSTATQSNRTETPLVTFEPTGALPSDTPIPVRTDTPAATVPGPDLPQTFVAFDADFFAEECPLFEGTNETREYGCSLGEYFMLHKAATTRYSFYDEPYEDAVVEASGYFIEGTGKYEYGIVFRANTEGTLYYVFTVTNDGRYNVSKYQNDKYTDLIPYTNSPLVNTGDDSSNTFKVVTRGSRFDFYLNDEFLNTVTDTTISGGVAGLFFYNAEAETEVGFDQFTISTFTPPVPTATPDAQNIVPTPTTASALATGVATSVPAKPGVYVSNLRVAPRAPKRGQPVSFFATFINSTGKGQNHKWLVEIWQTDTNKRYGQADGAQHEIPAGTHERATGDSWKVAGGGPCIAFRAHVVYEDDQARRVSFLRTNGSELWLPFQVCP
jgi:hypothetical protein